MNLLDTADVYGAGHNETLLGRAMAGRRREEAVVATKFGSRPHKGTFTVDSTPQYAKRPSMPRSPADARLDAGHLAALDAALPPGAAAGLRYPDQLMGRVDNRLQPSGPSQAGSP